MIIFGLCILMLSIFLFIKITLYMYIDPDASDAIEKEKMKRLAKKAIRDDAHLFKYVDQIVHEECSGMIAYTMSFQVFSVESIRSFLSSLKDNGSYSDYSAYQKDCIDRLDRMKNIIRNCYQNKEFYKKAAEHLLAYLSIVEVGLLTGPLNSENWDSEVYLRYIFENIYCHNGGYCGDGEEKTPEEWVEELKSKKVRPEEWCDLLLEDLCYLLEYHTPYWFDGNGWFYFL